MTIRKTFLILPFFFCFYLLNAQTGLVNFDGMFAPGLFGNQTTPTDDYSDGFVSFTGDWKVLDCSSFLLSGYSVPNGLKFSSSVTSNFESINFSDPVNAVSFNIGISATQASGMIQIEVFDNQNNLLETQNITVIGPPVTLVNIASSQVSRIDLTVENAGIIDDIAYTIAPAVVPTLTQWGIISLGLVLLIFSVVFIKVKTAQLA